MEKYIDVIPDISNWNFEHKLFKWTSIDGVTKIGCLRHQEMSEYSFKFLPIMFVEGETCNFFAGYIIPTFLLSDLIVYQVNDNITERWHSISIDH